MDVTPGNPIAHNVAVMFYHMGHGFEMEGQYDEAIHNYVLALKKDPEFLLARVHLDRLRIPLGLGLGVGHGGEDMALKLRRL